VASSKVAVLNRTAKSRSIHTAAGRNSAGRPTHSHRQSLERKRVPWGQAGDCSVTLETLRRASGHVPYPLFSSLSLWQPRQDRRSKPDKQTAPWSAQLARRRHQRSSRGLRYSTATQGRPHRGFIAPSQSTCRIRAVMAASRSRYHRRPRRQQSRVPWRSFSGRPAQWDGGSGQTEIG
jgi:hypothetical protein